MISYAQTDGEKIAKSINELLVSKGIPVWQDKVGTVGEILAADNQNYR